MGRRANNTQGAFTLVELLVVVCLIGLAVAIALPAMVAAFRSGADAQAINLITAYCSAARVLAVREGKYTCVHSQVGVGPNPACYIGIFVRDPVAGTFKLAQGYDVQRLPQDMCLGEVSPNTVLGNAYIPNAVNNPNQFTCFSVVFSPSGKVSTQAEGGNVLFNYRVPPFVGDPNTKIWDGDVANLDAGGGTTGEEGTAAMTLFSYTQYLANANKPAYLSQNGNLLALNVHTAQLFPRR